MSDPITELQTALAGRYTIGRELGQGGMATVYLADDLRHGRQVAIKVLRPELAAVLGGERFEREIAIASKLTHPHILPLLDSGELPGLFYYVMPYVAGESLRDRLVRETQLPLEDALAIADDVAAALAHAHSNNFIHRDIKPENILLGEGIAVVADFGIARAITEAGGNKLTQTGMAIGTPAYMSPEQSYGERSIDGRSDVYALACVVYEMLAGEPPYNGPTAQAIMARRLADPVPPLRTVRDSVPEGVERAIVKALSRVPADRYATATQFAAALRSNEPGPPVRVARPRRRGVLIGALAALALITTVATLWARGPMVIPRGSRIAILPFVSSTGDTALGNLGKTLVTTISSTLDQLGDLRVVDRFKVFSLTKKSPPTSLDQARVIASRLGAEAFVFGTLIPDAKGVRADLSVYHTQTGEPLDVTIVIHAPADSLQALSDSISWGVLHQLWRRSPPSPRLADVTTRSIPAMSAFLEGERDEVAGQYKEAAAAFHRAVDADSTFWVAAWRYNETLGWFSQDPDTAFSRKYEAHESAFTRRDRLIIEAERTVDMVPFESHLASLRQVNAEFPDDWPALWFYADHLAHRGQLIGYSHADVRQALERTVALNPDLVYGWEHLLRVSMGEDSTDTRAALESLTRLGWLGQVTSAIGVDVGLFFRSTIRLQAADGRLDPALLDSLAGAVPLAGKSGRGFSSGVLFFNGFPGAQVALDHRLATRPGSSDDDKVVNNKSVAWAWGERGSFDSLFAIRDRLAARNADLAPALETYRIAVAAAWMGDVDVATAAARREAAQQEVNRLPPGDSGGQRSGLAWADGALAALRHDAAALTAARNALRLSGGDRSRFLDRSLAALGRLGPSLATRLAADSLAALSLDAPETRQGGDIYAISVNHLAASRALLAVGDTARALKELTWTGADIDGFQIRQVFAPQAYLGRARIEAAQGHNDRAREDYHQFLRRYDAPSASRRHLVDEARTALASLPTGT